jgi:hypothetical protein
MSKTLLLASLLAVCGLLVQGCCFAPPPRTAAAPKTEMASGCATLTRSGPDHVVVGEEFSYTLQVTNRRAVTLEVVQVTESLEPGFELKSTMP